MERRTSDGAGRPPDLRREAWHSHHTGDLCGRKPDGIGAALVQLCCFDRHNDVGATVESQRSCNRSRIKKTRQVKLPRSQN